jgi:hypothetical protein
VSHSRTSLESGYRLLESPHHHHHSSNSHHHHHSHRHTASNPAGMYLICISHTGLFVVKDLDPKEPNAHTAKSCIRNASKKCFNITKILFTLYQSTISPVEKYFTIMNIGVKKL